MITTLLPPIFSRLLVDKTFGVCSRLNAHGLTVLDLGAGTGIVSRKFLESKSLKSLLWVDISPCDPKVFDHRLKFVTADAIKFLSDYSGPPFDLVLLIDFLEHLELSEVPTLLSLLSFHLHADSIVLIQVPNGDSPVSLRNFNNDSTHKTYFGSRLLSDTLTSSGFFPGQPIPVFDRPFASPILSIICGLFWVRFLYPFLSFLLFGFSLSNPNLFWSPNLAYVCRMS